MSTQARTLGVFTALLLAACSELQPIEANRCGNRIVEKGEACDEGGESSACTAECQLLCQTAASAPAGYVDNPEDASELACPAGQACGIDGLCSAPSGKFRTETTFEFDVPQAEVGDVDNDGVADLIGTGATEIRVRFGDADGAPLASASHMPAPAATGPFLLAQLDSKLGVDLAIPSDGGVVPFYATDSGTLQHRPTPTVSIPREGFVAAVDGVVTTAGGPRKPIVVYVEAQGNAAVLRDLMAMGNPEVARCDTGAPAALRLAPLSTVTIGNGDLLAVGISRAAAPGVCVFVPANPAAPTDAGWTGRFVPLAAGARFDVDTAPLVWANIDADSCPELVTPVVTGAGAGTAGVHVIESTATCTFSTTAVQQPTWALATGSKILGAGNLDRVGADELISTLSVLRVDSLAQVTLLGQPVGMDRLRVADFNGDGIADIAGVDPTAPMEQGREAIRILRTSGPPGTWQASTVVVETLRPVAQLAVGDFDGDRINDLAISEVITADANRLPTKMAVSVIYGQRSDIPSYQVVLEGDPVVIAALGMRRGEPHDEDGVDDLAVAKIVPGARIMASVLFGTAQRSLTAPLVASAGKAVSAIAAGRWNGDALLDLAVYAGTSQYVWPQLATGGFLLDNTARSTPVAPNGPRDFAIATAKTTAGTSTIVSVTTSQQEAAVGGIGGCPATWESASFPSFGQRPSLQARDVDGQPGDEILLTSTATLTAPAPIHLYGAIANDCKVGSRLVPTAHALSSCDAAAIIEAGTSGNPDPKRREILAVCRKSGGSVLTRFDASASGEVTGVPLAVQLAGAARRVLVGDFTGDGLEDAITINNVGAIDFATLLVQCATTDSACDQ